MVVAYLSRVQVSKRWLAAPHARVEVRALAVKTVMTVTVAVLYGQTKIQSLILCSTTLYLFYSYVRWVSE